MGRPSKAEARDTRREILDAALDLFSEGGFFGTPMRQIARAVGVRESALYHHFPSKDAILAALLEEFGARKLDALSHVDLQVVARVGADRMLRTFVLSLLEEWATPHERKFIRLILTEGPRLAARGFTTFPEVIERMLQTLAAFFAQLMERGLVRRRNAEVAAIELFAPVMMMRVRFMVMPPGPVDLRRVRALADEHVKYFWEAMRPIK
jgi:AcrR family transcriptional regulator